MEIDGAKMQACVGWLYVGMLPQYIQNHGVKSGSVKAMEDARTAVLRLAEQDQLGPLECAFGLKFPGLLNRR